MCRRKVRSRAVPIKYWTPSENTTWPPLLQLWSASKIYLESSVAPSLWLRTWQTLWRGWGDGGGRLGVLGWQWMEGLGDMWSGDLWPWGDLSHVSSDCSVGTAVDRVANAANRLVTSWKCILIGDFSNWISRGATSETGDLFSLAP